MAKALAQITIYDVNDIISSPSAPTSPVKDQCWLDTSLTPPVMKVWNGSKWVIENDWHDDVNKVQQQVTTTTERLNTATSDISVLKGKIALKVEQSDIDKTVTTVKNELVTKIDGIEVGGRNLLASSYVTRDGNTKDGYTSSDWAGTFIPQVNLIRFLEPETQYTIKYKFMLQSLADGTTAYTQNAHGTLFLYSGVSGYPSIALWDSSIDTRKEADSWVVGSIVEREATFITPKTLHELTAKYRFLCYTRRSMNGSTFVNVEKGLFYDIKLEKGNKATDWTPAPEDIDKSIADVITTTDTKIVNAKAEIKVETDKINLNVSNLATKTNTIETQLGDKATKSEVKTVSDKAATIEANLNAITQRVSSTESNISTVTITANKGISDAKIANDKATTAQTAANNAQSTANTANTNANKGISDAKAANDKATTAQNTANTANTKAIALEKLNFNNFSRTGNLDGWSPSGTSGNDKLILIEDSSYGQIGRITTDKDIQAYSDYLEIDSNKSYKLGLTLRKNSDLKSSIYFGLWCYDSSKNNLGCYVGNSTTLNTNVYYYSTTSKIANWFDIEGYLMASTVDKTKLPKGKNTSNCCIMHPKTKYVVLRFLNYYHDIGKAVTMDYAQPFIAEVDNNIGLIQKDIDALTTEVSSTKSKVAEIKTTTDAISSRVSTVEASNTTINGQLIAQETRLRAAESKITDSSIIATVSSQFYKKGETDTKYASQTQISQLDNKISSKVDVNGAISSVTQSFNKVVTDFTGQQNGKITVKNGNFEVQDSRGNALLRTDGGRIVTSGVDVYGNNDGTMNVYGNGSKGIELRSYNDGNVYLDFSKNSSADYHSRFLLTRNELNLLMQMIAPQFRFTGMDDWITYITVNGNFSVSGSKNCVVKTEKYGDVLINAYETASYYFGDIGRGIIGEDGLTYIWIEDKFYETVNTNVDYEVFLQKYGEGDVYPYKLTPNYFVVKGTPGINFAWELKAKRKGYEEKRLEKADEENLLIRPKNITLDPGLTLKEINDLEDDLLMYKIDNLI